MLLIQTSLVLFTALQSQFPLNQTVTKGYKSCSYQRFTSACLLLVSPPVLKSLNN